jgi:CheY-like chemotaxis protein
MSPLKIVTILVGILLFINLILAIRRWLVFHGAQWLVQDTHDNEDNRSTSEPDNTRRLKVMIVDDSLVIRNVMSKILEKNGYEVLAEADGEKALLDFNDFCPDLVFLDVEMPHMDGYEVASRIRLLESFPTVPIIMLSSASEIAPPAKGRGNYMMINELDTESILQAVRNVSLAS